MMPTIPAAVLGLLWVTIPGVFSLAVPAEGLLERQNNVDCERPGLKTTNVTAATNETGILEKRNYNGTCQLSWRDGSLICSGICYCLPTSACSASGNYCYFNTGNEQCYCT
ncbi:hypothetical protein N656DRAFT_764387 [Canariomyces notabilis]|uniref:Uncharacterized protein n=1 Tax=Canariomyces notabilis TaxID=2074819 RepID=A0AAN6TM95_9PEZI|nr:hypothetical protein N656DRAFT_764387 [Canariomyces arenarius]